jgi:septal ring factor EnvC (AmiA/AmiB activator)
MDAEYISQTLFWIVTTLILVLVSIVGFLFKHAMSKNDETIKEMKQDIDKNRETVDTKLSAMIRDFQDEVKSLNSAVVKTQHGEQISEIKRRIENKTKWLEDHDKEITGLDKRLTMVESDCKHYHKKGA